MNLDIYAEKPSARVRRKTSGTVKKPFDSLTAKELAALPREEYIANLPAWARDAVRKAWAASDTVNSRKR